MEYITLSKEAEVSFIEKKSEFIGHAAPVKTEEEAMEYINKIRKKYGDATHNCYAYMLANGSARYSDDGEPQGTAGVPILSVIQKGGFTDAVIVVTRYFGGILLGAGGLTRAYSGGAALAVGAAERVTICACTDIKIVVDYSRYGMMERLLPENKAQILDTDFGEFVTMTARLRCGDVESFEKALTQATSGTVPMEIIGDVFAPMKA